MPQLVPPLLAGLMLLAQLTGCAGEDSWVRKVREFELDNGMRFLLVPRGEAPIVTATIRFRAGGMDEDPSQSGLAHLLEHMAFKGTRTIGTRNWPEEEKILHEIERVGAEMSALYETDPKPDPARIEALRSELRRLHEKQEAYLVREEVHLRMLEAGGVDYNASTSQDLTTYYVSLPSDQLNFWARWESERIFQPVFREFFEERDVVLEERRMRIDNNPGGRLYEALLETAFVKSPYRLPTIGRTLHLQRLEPKDLRAFWGRHYTPGNAVGAIVGRFSPARIKRILKRSFGQIPRSPQRPEEPAPPPEEQSRERRVTVRAPAEPRLKVAYLKPNLPHWDDYVFDVLDEILGEGRTSRLHRALVLKGRIASEVSTHSGIPGSRLPNLYLVEILPLRGRTVEQALGAFDDEIEKIRSQGVTADEVGRAVSRLEADLIWRLRTNEGLSSELSYFEAVAGSWRYLETFIGEIRKVTPEDVRRVARTYLVSRNRTVAILKP